jgi:hypothetical protein
MTRCGISRNTEKRRQSHTCVRKSQNPKKRKFSDLGEGLQHGDEGGDGTGKAKTGLEARGGTGELDSGGGGGVVAAGGRGLEGLRDSDRASGVDDAGGGSAAGSTSADRGSRSVDSGGGGALGGGSRNRGAAGGLDGAGDRVAVGSDSRLRSRGRALVGAGRSRRGRGNGLLVGDAELRGVLVVAVHVVDELDSVATGAVSALEGGGRSPGVAAGVVDALDDDLVEDGVGGGALQQEQGDLVGGVGSPRDGERLASRDGLRRLARCFVWADRQAN